MKKQVMNFILSVIAIGFSLPSSWANGPWMEFSRETNDLQWVRIETYSDGEVQTHPIDAEEARSLLEESAAARGGFSSPIVVGLQGSNLQMVSLSLGIIHPLESRSDYLATDLTGVVIEIEPGVTGIKLNAGLTKGSMPWIRGALKAVAFYEWTDLKGNVTGEFYGGGQIDLVWFFARLSLGYVHSLQNSDGKVFFGLGIGI